MKTVFSGDMLFHVWAQNSQYEGRRSDGRVFFDGPTLYSYGRHFAIGHVMPDGATLLNSDSYSISTSKHQGQARAAVRAASYQVPALTDLVHSYGFRTDPKQAADSILRHVKAHALRFSDESALYLLGIIGRARSWPKIKREAERARDKAKAAARAREIAGRKGEAERMAALSDSDFAGQVAAVESSDTWGRYPSPFAWHGKEYRKGRPSETLVMFATELHRMGVTARAHCGKRVQATLKARLAAVRSRVADLKKWESHGDALAAYARNLSDLRKLYAERMATGPLSRDRNKALGNLANAVRLARPGLLTAKASDALTAIIRDAQALEKQAAEREAAERMERERADRESWLAGGGTRWTRFSDAQGGAMLRAVDVERDESDSIVGGTLETSHGADVPLPHALKAFAFVRRVVATGQPWHANGHTIRVGHFRVDSIDTAGTMRAGCHTLHLGEMERLAGVLGVADVAPSDDALEPSRGAA